MIKAAAVEQANEPATSSARGKRPPGLAPRLYGVNFADNGALTIGRADDPAEREADLMADNALSGLAPMRPNRSGAGVRRMCAECEEEENKGTIRRFASVGRDGHGGARAPAAVSQLLGQPGRPLDRSIRSDFEARFESGFGHVRVHDGPAAGEAARSIGATAFTSGASIVFGEGHYAPATTSGRRLLAHELAHVVQNGAAPSAGGIRRDPVDYTKMTINQLRKHLKVKAAVEELLSRYEKMTNVELARYAAGDELAASVYAKRIVVPVDAAGQGNFSSKGVQEKLAADIKADRAATKIPRTGPSAVQPDVAVEGGTVGSARTDIPGLENEKFVGRSPRAGGSVNPASEFPPATAMDKLPQTFGHAEQNIADQLDRALQKIPREQLAGRKVWMLIEQEPCSTCAQGATGAETAAGVLKKLSLKYPEIVFEIKSLESSSIIVLKGGAAPGSAAGGAASGMSGKSVQVETRIEVTKSIRTPEGTTVSEVEYAFGKGMEEVNAGAPAGSSVPGKVLVRVTQNADGSIAAVESLSGQPQAMVEALAHRTLSGAGTEVAAAAEGAGAGTAAAGARMALLFKGLKIGGTAAFAIITAYQLWKATPKERPRVLAGAASGLAGGMAASYVTCNLLLGIETLGWSLLFCGLIAGGAGGYLGSKGGEALYDAATATELDEALKVLETRQKNQIGTFNLLVARMNSDGCIDAQFVRDFIAAMPSISDTEAVLIAAQLSDAPIQPAAPAKQVTPKSFPAYKGGGGGVVCPGCHGRPMKDLVPPTMSPAEVAAWKTMPTCETVRRQGLAALKQAVANLPKAAPKAPLKPIAPASGPFDHKSPPGYVPQPAAPAGIPSEKEQLGTVCPNCHSSTNAPKTWAQFGPGLADPKKELSDMDRKKLIEWIQASPK